MDLGLDRDMLNACVQCGLCLTACPTYTVTGDESMSPRGRIALMREVQDNGQPVTEDVLGAFDTCIQCRGCEPACPSSVQFGRLMEGTRAALSGDGRVVPRWQRLMLKALRYPWLLRLGTFAIALLQRVVPTPRRLGLPRRLPLVPPPLEASGRDVHLFTGCVMDAWQRDVHHAAQRVLEAVGLGVAPSGSAAPCCGALHAHAGLSDETHALAEQVMAALDDGRPILVDSAGCGAALKDYGHILGSERARAFSARVYDVHEYLADHLDRLPSVEPLGLRIAVQDPCHLRHVQRAHGATRTVLRPFVEEIIELDDDGLCCGAGGMYSVVQPQLAAEVRDRKVAAIERASADLVASANPGCSMHLAAAGTKVVHPMQVIDRALRKAPAATPGGQDTS